MVVLLSEPVRGRSRATELPCFSALGRDIDLKCIQNTYRVVLNSLKKIIHRSMVKVTGMVHCFLKVQSYDKN